MNKADFNVVDNNDTQELAKGIAFLKSNIQKPRQGTTFIKGA